MNNSLKVIFGLFLLALAGWIASGFFLKDDTPDAVQINNATKEIHNPTPKLNHPEATAIPQSDSEVVKLTPKTIIDTEKTPKADKNTPAPELDIKLHGVFLTNKEKTTGFAIISFNNKGQKTYQLGSKLSDKVFLKRLTKDSIIIDNHGQLKEFKVSASSSGTFSSKKQDTEESYLPGTDAPPFDDSIPPPSEIIKSPKQKKEIAPPPPPPPEVGPFPES